MPKCFLRTRKYLLIVAMCLSCCAMIGSAESAFFLASDSRLPRCITLPPGLARTDVSVIFEFSATWRGNYVKLVLRDRKGKKLAAVKGKVKELTPSKYYHIVTEKGITEIITLERGIEHESRELFFYVIDDPEVRKDLLDGNGR
ncbi:MAG: hypothetical protein ABSA33_04120 [Candidatus Micrarchaeaceae archaeon]